MHKVRVFISYARNDADFLDRLLTHLAPLETEGLIEPWTDLAIEPGDHWDDTIARELNRAEIVLLLVSADFLASKYIGTKELATALERERRGEVVVIPVILKFADWGTSPFHHLQALPANAKPITDWRNRDQAYLDIALGIRRVISRLHGQPLAEPAPAEAETVWQDRVLDAAMAARIPLGKPSDLAVMVRLAGSAGLKAVLESDDEFTSQPEDVKSKPFQMEFGRDAHGKLKPEVLTVQIESPDFDPPSQSEDVVVPPDRDSDVTTFLLRPLFPGELVIKLKVFARDGRNAIRLLRIFSEASDRVIVDGKVVVSMPITAVAGSPRRIDTGAFPVPAPTMPPPAAPQPARKRSWILPSAGAAAGVVFAAAISLVSLTPKGAIQPPLESVTRAVDAPRIPTAAPPAAVPSRSPDRPSDAAVTTNLKLAASATGPEREKYLNAAVEGANKAVQLKPESAPAQYLRGVALERSGQFGEAESAFREATRLNPNDAQSWYGLGLALQKQNKTADARGALERAVELDPSNSDARLLLAAMLAKGNAAEAQKHVDILSRDTSLSPSKAAALKNVQTALKRNK